MLAGMSCVAGILAVTILSLLPQDTLPHMDVSDKVQHLIAYFCMALAGGIAFPRRRSLMALGFGLAVLGIGLEFAQMFVPGRFASIGDGVANTLGVVLGLSLARIVNTRTGLSA